MSEIMGGIRETPAPAWQRARHGESESLRIGFLWVEINRPLGTRGGPRPPLYITVGGIRLKREFDDWGDARAWAIRTATRWLEDAVEQARTLADAHSKIPPPQKEQQHEG